MSAEAIRKALAGFGGVKRRFTRTGDWNGATIFDDYGHHPVEIAAVLRAARASTKAHVIAIVQPHRYTRLHSLFDGFASCVRRRRYGDRRRCLSGRRGADRGRRPRSLVAALKARGHRARAAASSGREDLPGLIRSLAKPGDYVVFLGAGNITQWAHALPGQLAAEDDAADAAVPRIRARFPDLAGLPRMPDLRGHARRAMRRWRASSWFRTGGPAQVLFEPADESDLSYFLAHLDPAIPVLVLGAGSNILLRDGGVEGVVIRLGKAVSGDLDIDGLTLRAGAGVPDVKLAPPPPRRASRVYRFFAAFQARLAARCG